MDIIECLESMVRSDGKETATFPPLRYEMGRVDAAIYTYSKTRHSTIEQMKHRKRNNNCTRHCPEMAYKNRFCDICRHTASTKEVVINNIYLPKFVDIKKCSVRMPSDNFCRNTLMRILVTPVCLYIPTDTTLTSSRNMPRDMIKELIWTVNISIYHVGGDICSLVKHATLGQMEDIIGELDEYSDAGLGIEILTAFSCIWNEGVQMAVTDPMYDPRHDLCNMDIKRLQELRSKLNRVSQDNTYRGNVINKPPSLYLISMDKIVKDTRLRNDCYSMSKRSVGIMNSFCTNHTNRRNIFCMKWKNSTYTNKYVTRRDRTVRSHRIQQNADLK